MVEDVLTTASIKELTNRKIYRSLISLASVKVTRDNPGINYSLVWKRLQSSVIPYEYRDSLLLLVHNKLPVPERMNRLGLIDTPLCQYCNGNDETADIVHFFCSCVRTRRVWSWLRVKLISLSSSLQHDTNWTLLNLAFTAKASENEVVWLLSQYVYNTWKHFSSTQVEVKVEKFFGFLSWKYKIRNAAVGNIVGLE